MSPISIDIRVALSACTVNARFDAPPGAITSLFGPSGAGKTTVLRAIAGLERRARGTIRVNGETWLDSDAGVDLPPHRRGAGYVFQEASLFPHLNVRENLHYARRRARPGIQTITFESAVDRLGLGGLLERDTATLSGGERQRVAMARALLSNPRLLLLDEPLASLDEASRSEVLPCIEGLQSSAGLPILYVSHNLREVARLSRAIVEIRDGVVVAVGPASAVLRHIARSPDCEDDPVAILDGTIIAHDSHYHLSTIQTGFGQFQLPAGDTRAGESRRLQIAARDVSLGRHFDRECSILNQFEAEIATISGRGPGQVLVEMTPPERPDGPVLMALVTSRSCEALALAQGTRVFARIKGVQVME